MAEESFLSQVKRLLVGKPIPSHLAHHERLSRVTGLAVLSSDPLSSVAYATEEILRVLTIGGVAALGYATPIGALIATMLAIVVFSYRQTIYAYPARSSNSLGVSLISSSPRQTRRRSKSITRSPRCSCP